MHHPLDRRRLLLSMGLGLVASITAGRARGHEIITSTMRITHPWSRATAPGAAFAVLCMKFDEVSANDRLVLVETPVARGAELGGTAAGPVVDFPIRTGEETYLAETGTYVRLVDLAHPLELGRIYPLRLGFEKGGTYVTTFSIDRDLVG